MPQAYRFDLAARKVSTVETVESLLVLSSPPYPVELGDSVRFGCALSGGVLSTALYALPLESVSLSASLSGGTLRTQLQNFSPPVETLGFSASLSGGELRVLLRATDIGTERVRFAAGLSGGDLAVKLVQYTGWPVESAAFSCNLVGGSLV